MSDNTLQSNIGVTAIRSRGCHLWASMPCNHNFLAFRTKKERKKSTKPYGDHMPTRAASIHAGFLSVEHVLGLKLCNAIQPG